MFGGENNTSLANDLWTLRGLGLDGEEAPAWIPLELPGTAPAPRKGHSCTCKQDAIIDVCILSLSCSSNSLLAYGVIKLPSWLWCTDAAWPVEPFDGLYRQPEGV